VRVRTGFADGADVGAGLDGALLVLPEAELGGHLGLDIWEEPSLCQFVF
jgi:hypothetical protein